MPRERNLGKHGRQPKKTTLMQKCANWVYAHKVLSAIGVGIIALAIFCLIFWFSIFSGLSSSADFIYSKF